MSSESRCAATLNYLIRSKHLSLKTKLRAYKTIVLAAMLLRNVGDEQKPKFLRWEHKIIRKIRKNKIKQKRDIGGKLTKRFTYKTYHYQKIDDVIKSRRLQ